MPQNRRQDLPMQTRLAPVTAINVEKRTVDLVWTTGARVRRRRWIDWDRFEEYFEELSVQPGQVRLERLNKGAPLLNTHGRWNLADVLGVVEEGSARLEDGKGVGTVRFSEREDVQPIFKDVKDKIVRNVSVGYAVYKVEKLPPDERSEGLPIERAIDWEPMELSLVPVGADAGAGVRAEHQQQRTFPCEIVDRTVAENPADSATTKKGHQMETEQEKTARLAREAEAARQKEEEGKRAKAAEEAAGAELERVQEIRKLCTAHKVDRTVEDKLINEKVGLDKARELILAKLAEQTTATQIRGGFSDIYLVGSEALAQRTAMVAALEHRINPKAELPEAARDYRYLSLRELARVVLEREGVRTKHMTPMEIAGRSLMGTSDFPNLLADVMNKRLRAAYAESTITYRLWARRAANAPDFKDIKALTLANAPALQAVLPGAEFKTGSLSEGKEVYAITTYGRIVSFTRQAIVNDDLRAFERFPSAFAGSARRLENSTVYGILLANANMGDGVALFHANHGNLPSAATIDATSLGAARALMRKQTGLQTEKLNIAPKFLLAGPDKEQLAYQFTSSQFVPAEPAKVNEFRQGGRTALTPVVDSEITGNKWFLAADPNDIDTVEYCYLDGSEGVFLESRMGFTIDGVDMKARLDFAAKAIDYRGLVYNSGA
jgi:hypothetical protein